MTVAAIISISGGVGKTTLTANLAAILSKRGIKVLVVEWEPANRLAFHLGVREPIDEGWVAACINRKAWNETAYQNSDNVTFLPFGQLNSAERTQIEQLLIDQPGWLAEQLSKIDLGDDCLILLDVERGPSVYMTQALTAADLALLTMKPTPCYNLEIDYLQQELRSLVRKLSDPLEVKYLLNFADPTRRASADNAAAMMQALGDDLLHYLIHQDEAVPEALAGNAAIADFAPHSQASHDLQGLASWLLHRIDLSRGG